MPKRVVFSFEESDDERTRRLERERLQSEEWRAAGKCPGCGHRPHDTFKCGERVEGAIFRQCFGANPHTRVEYHACVCATGLDGLTLREKLEKARAEDSHV